MTDIITFYRIHEPYGCFSNYAPYPVEHSPKDPFWTDGGDGSGENTFGRLLMELRAELQAAPGERAA